MMNDFPKMLYTGNTKEWEHETATNADHESELREQGFMDFNELEAPESKAKSVVLSSSNQLKQELIDALKEKEEIEKIFSVFRNDVDAMRARIAELEPISALGSVLQPETNYSEKDNSELKEILTQKGIKFKVNSTKAELLALLGG